MTGTSTYGGFWIRTLAYSVDMAILMVGLLLLGVLLTFMGGAGAALYGLIAVVGPIAYFAWLTASGRQATFGKQLCGLKVQHAGSGERISLLRSIARELGKLVSAAILMIGFLLVAFTGRKQGLHDMLASTEVVREGTARIGLALFVAIAGVVVPVIIVPLMFGALFAGLMMAMMGGTMGESAVKSAKPVPTLEQKAAPRPAAPAAASTAASAPKPAATEPVKPAAVATPQPAVTEPVKPAAVAAPKPVAAAAPVAAPAPSAPAPQPRAAPSRSAPAAATPSAPVLQQSKPPCVYKPVMTDEEIARCR